MEKNFMTAYRKIMEHALTGKAVRTQVFAIVWLLLILIKKQVDYLCIAFRLHLYIFQFKPVKHMIGKKTFRKYSVLFHSDTFFDS